MQYFTPGPSALWPQAAEFIQEGLLNGVGSISHRSKEFESIYAFTVSQLRRLLRLPESHTLFFLSSATEAWERILMNCVDESSFHLVNGNFSERFFKFAKQLQRKAWQLEVPFGEGFENKALRLPDSSIELIGVIGNESSSGVCTSPEKVADIASNFPDQLLAADLVSVVPALNYPFEKLDCSYFSVQKCFGMPAGLGVLILSPRALNKGLERKAAGELVGTYHSFASLQDKGKKNQTPETPNVLYIYVLGRIAEAMNQLGLEKIQTDIRKKADMVYDFFEQTEGLRPHVKSEADRSPTVLVAETRTGSARWIEKAKEAGFMIGAGYGKYKKEHIRIANFPAHNVEAMASLLKALSN